MVGEIVAMKQKIESDFCELNQNSLLHMKGGKFIYFLDHVLLLHGFTGDF